MQSPNNYTPPTISANIKIPPGLFFLLGLIAGFGFELLTGISWSFPGWTQPAGGVLMILGLGVFFAAFFTLRKAGTAFDPLKITSALVTHGIFRLTRNPAYLGGVITYTGINLLGSGLVSLILLPVIIIIIQRYAIRREEVYLEKCFGHMYKEYQNRVRQWI